MPAFRYLPAGGAVRKGGIELPCNIIVTMRGHFVLASAGGLCYNILSEITRNFYLWHYTSK